MENEMMNTKDASNYLGVAIRTLLEWSRSGKVKAYKLGKFNYYKKSDLDSLYRLDA